MTESPSYPKLVQIISALEADLVKLPESGNSLLRCLSTRYEYKSPKSEFIQ